MKNKKFPVYDMLNINKCSGCETCNDACPTGAIRLIESGDGFIYPDLDATKCINCKKCVKVCPILNLNKIENENEVYIEAYCDDEEILLNSASGGMFTFLYNQFKNIYQSGFVAGAIYSDDCKSIKHIVSNDESDFEKMRGSKYFQSKKNNIYKKVKELLDNNEAVLFSGSPCEVAGLYLYLDKKYDKLWTIDYICKGPSSPKILREYVSYLENKYKSNMVYINMRYKWKRLDNWIPQFLKIKFDNGKTFLKEFYNTELGMGFRIIQRKGCEDCPFKENMHYSDFTIGDRHGINKGNKIFNHLGTSVIVINTPTGKNLWNLFDKSSLKYSYITKDDVYRNNRSKADSRNTKLRADIEKYNSIKAIRMGLSIKEKIKLSLPVRIQRIITMRRR